MKTTDDLNELFVVVDKDDKIIGYKSRFECHHNKSLIHRSTGIMLFNKEGKILLQERSATKDLYPKYYTLSSSGHVTKGEEYEQAAMRELKEEIGAYDVLLERVKKLKMNMERETEFVTIFKGKSDGPFIFNNDETKSVAFYSKKDVQEMKSKLTPLAKAGLQIIGWL